MPLVSWKLRLLCGVLTIVAAGSLVGASEVGAPPNAAALAAVLPAPSRVEPREPRHAEPGPELLERVAMVSQRDATGWRFPSGLKIGGGTKRRMFLFTFDDGPSRRTTPRLLDVLDELGIKAVFFVTSESFGNGNPWEREHAGIVRDIVERGHTLGNHTETHRQLPLLNNAEIQAELTRSGRKIAWATGSYPRLIRPPGGATSKRLEGILAENRYTTVMWALYPADLEVRRPEAVVKAFFRVLERRERETGDRGGIVLMHDTKAHSLAALPRLVDAIHRRNCGLLERGEELYDIVDDLGYFIPGYHADQTLEERQAALREETAHRCAALAVAD